MYLGLISLILAFISSVSALGTSCSAPLGPGTAAPGDAFWLQNIKHQGTAAFNANPGGYQVFRNVKDFGARGDGVTDDTAAINNAISAGGRCGGGSCHSSTVTPAVVYFPAGTYLVTAPIIPYYYTQLIGDARHPPTLLAAANFVGMAIIDADPYIPGGGGAQWYTNQNNFFRSVRNFVLDTRRMPASATGTGIHWQVAQATSLMNIVFQLSTAAGTAHQGIWMENGSGGYMGDMVFNGGKFGMWVGNQQFTVRNITVNNAETAVFGVWNWGWTFQGVTINNCQVGFDLSTGGVTEQTQTVGAEAIIDAVVSNTPIFVRTSQPSNGRLAGSVVLNNVRLTNVPVAVGVVGGAVVLNGGTTTISSWGQGNVFTGTNPNGVFTQGTIPAPNKPAVLLDGSGKIFGKTHPQYADYALSQFVSVKDHGARGDGRTDDTAALQAIFNQFSGCKIIFFDAGTYIVTSTLTIPAGTQMVGEAWSVIAGQGANFGDFNNPKPVVKVGDVGSQGVVEITDIIFSTVGSTPGAIVVEWNVKQPANQQGGAGMWDSHIRLGGAAGTNLERSACPSGSINNNCFAAFMGIHITSQATAYLEGTWVWLADHDLDGDGSSQISIFSGRGILSESAGPVWLIGTASEHHVLYQYNLVNAKNHYMGLIQTETPYFQPAPAAPAPFQSNSAFHDPTFSASITMAWALRVQSSTDIIIFGAGLYSFFQNYNQDCLNSFSCQNQLANIDSASSVHIYSLSTVATTFQLSVNQNGVINQAGNRDGFASTATSWSPVAILPHRANCEVSITSRTSNTLLLNIAYGSLDRGRLMEVKKESYASGRGVESLKRLSMLTAVGAIFVWLLTLRIAAGVPTIPMVKVNTNITLGLNATSVRKEPFWLEVIKHQGIAPFHPNAASYKVFRNVKDYGAKGDGETDDTAAINLAISDGGRCGEGKCPSSTRSPALVYFPAGKFVVSRPIVAWYYTQLIGDARNPPTIIAAPSFNGMAVIDADPYIPFGGGQQWYTNQNNFFRSVRNFVIDLRRTPASSSATGIHWQVAQATSLMNIVVHMSTKGNTGHQGIWMENGSGGFMGDLTFNGGKYGIWGGNQQFTVRNIAFNNVQTAFFGVWNWGWTFQGVTINNCEVGFDLSTGDVAASQQGVGSEVIIDADVTDTPIFIRSSASSNGQLRGSLVLNNIQLVNVKTAVGVVGGEVVLEGGKYKTIDTWGQGNIYSPTVYHKFTQGEIASPSKPSMLLDRSGKIFGKMHPQYEGYPVSKFLSARDHGCKGDGQTDDTAVLQALLDKAAGDKIVFLDAGVYIITDTLKIPIGSRLVGEAWSVISGRGEKFQNLDDPRVMVQVGEKECIGVAEITDVIFSTVGPAGGAIVVEWNARDPEGQPGSSGMWDSHIRLGGAAGTNLDHTSCPAGSQEDVCMAAYLALHLTKHSSAYLEGTWVWLADHDLDDKDQSQITLFSGRGILSESQGPVWMIGTASEHHVLYQYNLHEARNHYMGLIQTETPYFQPTPPAPQPFALSKAYKDPSFESTPSAWALYIQASHDIIIFGAGLYSFFYNYSQACIDAKTCQSQIANVDKNSNFRLYGLSTVGVTYQFSVNERGLINQADNQNGFQETVTAFWTDP